MDYNKWVEEKILKLSSNKNYEDYPNQMKHDLEKQANKYNLELFSYNKSHYLLSAVLKDKTDDRYISVTVRDLSSFKDRFYKNVELRYMKNPNIVSNTIARTTSWNDIGSCARRLVEWKKRIEHQKEQEEELEKEI